MYGFKWPITELVVRNQESGIRTIIFIYLEPTEAIAPLNHIIFKHV